MRKLTTFSGIIAALALVAMSGCLKDKIIDVVVQSETYAEFDHVRSEAVVFTNTASIDLAAILDDALLDADINRDEIIESVLEGVSYGVLSNHFPGSSDFEISGSITVEREDLGGIPATFMTYDAVKLSAAMGQKIPGDLDAAGVSLVTGALGAYLGGGNPVLKFVVNNDAVIPTPSASDPIGFVWKVWLSVHVVGQLEVEVPDPF